jgi:hypothetical protein
MHVPLAEIEGSPMHTRRLSLGLLAVVSAILVTAPVALATSGTAKPCILVAKGAPWSTKGQKGTTYTVLGVNGGSCTAGVAWLKRLTTKKGFGIKGPPGYTCNVLATLGQCTTKGGAIIEFAPRLRK